MARPALTWSSDPAAGSHAQTITIYRGEDAVIPFAPAAATACPAALGFVVAETPEGDPLFAELTVGGGITITDAEDGEFSVRIPRTTTAEIAAGDYVWAVWDLDGDRELLAAGLLTVRATARIPG